MASPKHSMSAEDLIMDAVANMSLEPLTTQCIKQKNFSVAPSIITVWDQYSTAYTMISVLYVVGR